MSLSLRRRLRDDDGFTLVEVLAAITILAVGAFAAAQALMFGLGTSGLARQRLAARAVLNEQMEQARALNYDNLVLSEVLDATDKSTDPDNPDYWLSIDGLSFDPTMAGGTHEPLIMLQDAAPSLHHVTTQFPNGGTTFDVYRYVTWADSPTDGSADAGTDEADGNDDGVDDADGRDQKRVTIVVTWTDQLGRGVVLATQSSLFSDGKITYKAAAKNAPPSVSCPTVSVSGMTATFSLNAADSDGSIASATWNFGDGVVAAGLGPVSHTYTAYDTYIVENNVTDNVGATGSNDALNCAAVIASPWVSTGGPDGTVTIRAGATYSTSTVVTLTLAKISSGATPAYVRLSNDAVTWSPFIAFGSSSSTTTSWTMLSGDGTKTVFALFYDGGQELHGSLASDTIVLDTTPPGAPTGLAATTTVFGANVQVNLSWIAPVGAADLSGYRVWRRLISSTTWTQVSCSAGTSCSDAHKQADSYEYYVEAYDLAGNTGAQSDHITS